MSFHNHIEQLKQLNEVFESHGRRLESLANQLLGNDQPPDGLIRRDTGMPDGPSPKPSYIMGTLESGTFDLRLQVERIGGAINRLESVIQDPRNATASASKY